jgi:hypothetical protein
LPTTRHWYEGFWPAAPVGVLAMLSQALAGDRPHVGAAQGLLETLQMVVWRPIRSWSDP